MSIRVVRKRSIGEQTEPEYMTLSLALRGARGQRVLRRYKNNGALSTTILSSNGRETVAVKQCFRYD